MKTSSYSFKTLSLGLSVLLSIILFSNTAKAQCVPVPSYTHPDIYPDASIGIPPIIQGVPYNTVITVVPVEIGFPNTPDTLVLNPIWVTRIDSVPPFFTEGPLSSIGLSYSCSTPYCMFTPGSSGCITITGTPNVTLGPNDRLKVSLEPMNFPFPSLMSSTYTFDYAYDMDIVTGVVYDDLNGNCIQDVGEPGLAGRVVSATPGNNHTITTQGGGYSLKVQNAGIHDFTVDNQAYWQNNCPSPAATHTVDVTTQNLIISGRDFGSQRIPNINDIQVLVTNLNCARPGFQHHYKVDVKNVGTTTLSGTVELQHDALLHFSNHSFPIHSSYNNNIISWDYGPLQPGETTQYRAYFTVDTQAVLGDYTYTTASAYPVNGDTVPADNVDNHAQIIQGSYDPNDKAVVPAEGITPEQVAAHHPLTYHIRFQNTGTDTAFTVVVRDTLSSNLEIETFEMLSTSHPCTTELEGPGYLKWTFNNILLPDSNVNEPASHGYIKYRIKPKSNLVLGDEIHNTAAIYFDFNTPVITNTTVTEVKILEGISEAGINLPVNIYPNPTSDLINIEITDRNKVGSIELLMTNVSGQVIKQLPLNQIRTTIVVDDLASGFYFISLTENDKIRDTRKVVISKR